MFSLFRTLSLRYLWHHWLRATLIVASIALGVAAWIATQALYGTVTRSLHRAANPFQGSADFYITSPTGVVDASLTTLLKTVPGVKRADPLIIENIHVAQSGKRTDAILIGLEVPEQQSDSNALTQRNLEVIDLNVELFQLVRFKNTLKNNYVQPLLDFWLVRKVLQPSLLQPAVLRPLVVPYVLPALERLARVQAVLIGEQLDKDVLKGRKQFYIEAGDRREPVIVVGKVRATGTSATLGGQAVLMEWAPAAKLLGREGKVHRIDVALNPDADPEDVRQRAEVVLGGQAKVQTAVEQDRRLDQVLKGLERGFMLCGAGALVVGLFLVYNAMSVSVVERRHDIGILRSTGATRTQVRVLFLSEAALMGLVGSLLGIPLGIAIARVGLKPIQDLVSGIFRQIQPSELRVSPALLGWAGLGGFLTALVAALVPASRAAAEEPADAVRRVPPAPGIAYRLLQIGGSLTLIVLGIVLVAVKDYLTPELVLRICLGLVGVGVALTALGNWLLGRASEADLPVTARYRPLMAIVYGLIFVVVGCAGLILRDSLTAETGAFAAYLLVFFGSLLLAPVLAAWLTQLLQRILRGRLPIESRLALDNLVRSPGRTGLVVAALTAGVALTLQTAGMIKSNQTAYRRWIDAKFQFDLLLTADSAAGVSVQPRSVPPTVADTLRKDFLPAGTRLVGHVYRNPEWDAKSSRPGLGGGTDRTFVFLTLLDATEFYEAKRDSTRAGARAAEVDELDKWRLLGETPGQAIISENFAEIHKVKSGDTIQLGPSLFKVVGIVEDYTWIRGSIWIDLPSNRAAFGADSVNAWEVYLPPNHQDEAAKIRDRVQKSELGARHTLIGQTHAEVREDYVGMIQRVFSLFYTQEVVVGVVAVIGVVTSLLISVLGRTREIGLLRAVGATRGQVMHTVLAEAVLIGIVGTILGIVVGLPLEWYLVRVLLFEETGFLFPVLVPWLEMGVIIILAVGSATLAGQAPAIQATRLRIADAIAYE